MSLKKVTIRKTEDVLSVLCTSVSNVLSKATGSEIRYSPTIQKITKTCLKPDIGCFVLFEGAFSGLIIINMSADAAVEIYQSYMKTMGMSEKDLAINHTSDEVSNTLGELMNQMVGNFQGQLEHLADLSLYQTQPKMLVINKELVLSFNTNLDRPQSRRVVFTTEKRNTFYLEMSMEKTEFVFLDGEGVADGMLSKNQDPNKMIEDLDI